MKETTIDTPLREAFDQQKMKGATGTEAAVCKDIADRQRLGIAKYGQTVAENPIELRGWLQHAYEECIDQAVYLKRAIIEIAEEIALERLSTCDNERLGDVIENVESGDVVCGSCAEELEELDPPKYPEEPEDLSRACEHCGGAITDPKWIYGWCLDCLENGKCAHGNKPDDCEKCDHEGDLAFHSEREKR